MLGNSGNRFHLLIALVILLTAAVFRLIAFGEAPPGLQHDEIFKGNEGRLVAEEGDIRLFYPSNQGHEGAYVWFIGLAYALLDSSILSMRFPSFVFGMLTIALLYRFGGQVYGRRVGAIAAGLAAVSFWTVYVSRVGLRATMLPPVILLIMLCLWWLLCTYRDKTRFRWELSTLTGGLLGFAIYTYTSSVAIYAAYALFLVMATLFSRQAVRRRWRELVLMTLLGAILTMPMILIRMDDSAQNRIQTIIRPWESFRDGDPEELIENAIGLAGMFAFTGDPEWRYNLEDRPLFIVPIGLLAYVGFVLLLVGIRKRPINAMLLGLLVAGAIPSLLTVSAPSYLRSLAMVPPTFLAIALTIDRFSNLIFRQYAGLAISIIGGLVIGVTGLLDANAYFNVWSNHDEVLLIYRDDLEQLADELSTTPTEELALITVDDPELDPLVYYSYDPSGGDPVFFFSFSNIVLSTEPMRLYVSPASPISAAHAAWLTEERGTAYVESIYQQDGSVAFDIYEINAEPNSVTDYLETLQDRTVYTGPSASFPPEPLADWGEPLAYPVNFANRLALIGLEIPREQIFSTDDGVNNQLFLRPLIHRTDEPLMIYLHLLREDGTVAAQRDLMGVLTPNWHRDTIIQQDNYIIGGVLEPGRYIVAMGLYNWQTLERYPVLDADGNTIADRVILAEINVVLRQ